ncbi:MAG TPA: alpha-L-arabinofuranosidase C-terminal domain-containing protein [Opitutaceae bacterium]
MKVVNGTGEPAASTLELSDGAQIESATLTVLRSGNPSDENTFESPDRVIPRNRELTPAADKLPVEFPAYSLSVIRARLTR